ncbi:MAG: hypothetical protein SFU25_11085 [Candidatus Caenarcaniphilales bacterium]|nr:hypothetical protein [Candidatus Caenarcaniphilales bacterium]
MKFFKLKKTGLFVSATVFQLLCINSGGSANPAFSIPPSAQAGAIMNHDMNYLMLQQRAPWVTGPSTRNENRYREPKVFVEEGTIPGETSTQGMLIAPDGTGYITGDQ